MCVATLSPQVTRELVILMRLDIGGYHMPVQRVVDMLVNDVEADEDQLEIAAIRAVGALRLPILPCTVLNAVPLH